ncbi:MAG: FHA domain-containing protein, partial [Deltaproteobacteria bacterium]
VYSIGATLYELLTGEAPEPKKMPTHFRGYDARIHPRFRAIVLKALDQVPANRYPTANDMRRALLDIPNVQEWMPRPLLPIDAAPRNLHPLYASFCPACGHPPKRTTARYCGKCRRPYHTAFLKIFPSRPDLFPMELYLKGRRTLIGREDPENEIFPDIDLSRFDEGRYVSRRHAEIERRGGRFVLRTISTTNPTLLEGKRILPDHEVPLEPGVRLQFADLAAAFIVKPCFEAFEISPSDPIRRDGTEGNR